MENSQIEDVLLVPVAPIDHTHRQGAPMVVAVIPIAINDMTDIGDLPRLRGGENLP